MLNEMIKHEEIKEICVRAITLSSEGLPLFQEKVPAIIEASLRENKPILFATVMCRISKLTGHANRRFWSPDTIWAKERNDQPLEITLESARQNGIDLINPKLALIFKEMPETLKKISAIGAPWRFIFVIADDPNLEARKSLGRHFKRGIPQAFDLMCLFHRLAIQRVFSLGLENAGIVNNDQKVQVITLSRSTVDVPELGGNLNFIDAMAAMSEKLASGNLSGLPSNILKKEPEGIEFVRRIEPLKNDGELRRIVREDFITSTSLAGLLLHQIARKTSCAGPIILSAIHAEEPFSDNQSAFLPGQEIPVIFPFKQTEGQNTLGEISPVGELIPPGSTWFTLATGLTLELVKTLRSELEKLNPQEKEIAETFMPVIFGERRKNED